jgi:predicted amidohydrolase YtcJ
MAEGKTKSVGEQEARDVAEAARETGWDKASFARELFNGRFRLDLLRPFPKESPQDRRRGDAYREQVDARDLNCLYRVRSWLEAGVPLAAGTDAPFGDPDPWRAMRAAIARRTESGACLGRDEIVSPETALRLFVDGFSHSAEAPSETASIGSESAAALAFRNLAVGQRADFCLLDTPWREARQALSRDRVALTIRAGRIIWPEND